MINTKELIAKLELQPHPEGGYFRETYRSEGLIEGQDPTAFPSGRNFSTAIYFLLQGNDFSAFHRIRSDELWHFYAGVPLHIFIIDEQGTLSIVTLGNNPESGEVYQALVPAGRWFASAPARPEGYALVGCTVAPGFDFGDFEMAVRAPLTDSFPQHKEIIRRLTRS